MLCRSALIVLCTPLIASFNFKTESMPVWFLKIAGEGEAVKSKISRALTENNLKALEEFLKGSRYFIIKSNNHENVSLSKAKVGHFVFIPIFYFDGMLLFFRSVW